MDRDLLERRLAAAETNVALGFKVIADQRQAVASLDAWGLDSTIAHRMLQAFEEMQAGFIEDLEAATAQLAADDQRMRNARLLHT